jgi:hypothetical protein
MTLKRKRKQQFVIHHRAILEDKLVSMTLKEEKNSGTQLW